jgi:hypothetical protein
MVDILSVFVYDPHINGKDAKMLTDLTREWAYAVAGSEVSDEEVLLLVEEYEDYLVSIGDTRYDE